MPMTLNVGLSRKAGEPNYGSKGASINFEVELEANVVDQPALLKDKARYLFGLAKEAVEEELNGHALPATNGHNGSQRSTTPRPATASQVRAIHAIADRHNVDLLNELRHRFTVETPGELSITTASELIDSLKSTTNGSAGRR